MTGKVPYSWGSTSAGEDAVLLQSRREDKGEPGSQMAIFSQAPLWHRVASHGLVTLSHAG